MGAMRRCTKCGQEKPATYEFFPPARRISDGCASWCRVCDRAAAKARWDALTPEQQVAKNRARWEKTKKTPELLEKHRDSGRRYAAQVRADPEKQERKRVQQRALQLANPERTRKYCQAYRERNKDNPEYRERVREQGRRQYWKAPLTMRARNAHNRATRAEAPGGYTADDVQRLFKSQNGCCAYCGDKVGRNVKAWHIDHFIPLARGGTNWPDNLVLSCAECNLQKHAKMPWEFMPEKFQPPEQSAAD